MPLHPVLLVWAFYTKFLCIIKGITDLLFLLIDAWVLFLLIEKNLVFETNVPNQPGYLLKTIELS